MAMEDDPAFVAAVEAGRYMQARFYELREVSEIEIAIAADLEHRAPSLVHSGDSKDLRSQGFRKGHCHENCRAAAASGAGEHVYGWTVANDRYYSHSVIRRADGQLHCITPEHTGELDEHGRFWFVEDDRVICDGERMYWCGKWLHPFNTIVRRDPEMVRARYQTLLDRISAGELRLADALATDGGEPRVD